MNENPASPAPTVSVVVPVYNARDMLVETLDRIAAQDFRDWECICVNDGSTDGSDELIRSYATRDSRFRLISQRNTGLAAAARNRGIDEARGEFIAFVDADDWVAPGMLGACVARMRADDSDICAFEVSAFDAVTHEIVGKFAGVPLPEGGQEHGVFCPQEFQGNLFLEIPASTWNKMYRASFLREHRLHFPETLRCSEDTVFSVCGMAWARRISCIAQVYYHYRRNRDGSLTCTLGDKVVSTCSHAAGREIWRALRRSGRLAAHGIDAMVLTLANACWYNAFLRSRLVALRGTWRLWRWKNACLKELAEMDVRPSPEQETQLRHYMSRLKRGACPRFILTLWQFVHLPK